MYLTSLIDFTFVKNTDLIYMYHKYHKKREKVQWYILYGVLPANILIKQNFMRL